jgi:superfamily II DNA or RNA helicase
LWELLAVSGLSLSEPAWASGLQGYARSLSIRLPEGDLTPLVEELTQEGLVTCQSGLLTVRGSTEDVLLRIRLERRAGLVSQALYEDVFPFLTDAFAKASVHFRTGLLFGTARFVSGGGHSPRELAAISRGWRRPESFQYVEARWQGPLLERSLEWAVDHCEEAPGAVAFLERQSTLSNELLLYLGVYWLTRGNSEQTLRMARAGARIPSLPGLIEFCHGHFAAALDLFQQATVRSDSPVLYLPLARLCMVICWLGQGQPDRAERACSKETSGLDPWLRWLCDQRLGKARLSRPSPHHSMTVSEWLAAATSSLILSDVRVQAELVAPGQSILEKARQSGFGWVATQIQRLLQRFSEPGLECCPWDHVPPQSPWKLRLDQLLGLARQPEEQKLERLTWSVAQNPRGAWEITPRLQTRAKKGGWTRGKAVEMYRQPPPCADIFDVKVFRMAHSRACTTSEVFHALVGHPRVFHGDTDQALEVVECRPQFQVHEMGDSLHIRIQPPSQDAQGLVVRLEGQAQLKIYRYNERLRQFSDILGEGLEVPSSQRDCVLQLLEQLPEEIAVASDLAPLAGREIQGDPSLIARVRPWKEGLEIHLLVRPLGHDGPEFPPTLGGQRVLTTRQGQRIQAVRPLEQEHMLWQQFLDACPALDREQNHWSLPDLTSSLEALEQIGQLPASAVTVEWPEGQSLKIRQRASASDLRVAAESSGDWFQLKGQLNLSSQEQWHLEQLLEQLRNSNGRFIALGSGEFLALTEDLRQRLQGISQLVEPKGKGLRVHPLAAGLMQEVTPVSGDAAFQERLRKATDSQHLQVALPVEFQAHLRSYQLEGFQWLAQRAHWGVGACLADDMGLGKTLQALALLLLRAPLGPALVIAPTSVCGNWLEEARRFAPVLRVHWLAEGERLKPVQEAAAFDVVLVSYGLLMREIDSLSARHWATLVLDEAQAIKNHATQRFQAVLKLHGDFKMITTGTPVENRLEELWALFRFLNPGLLGSIDSFRRRYVQPLESGDEERRGQLKRLIHPFLLRRTKSQVLSELPARTDIQLEVELTASERTFYEALRTRAMEKLAGGQVEAVAVLAELTRLRRACCHPSLVEKKRKSREGSKLAAVRELLSELRLGDHKALIFSQFVDHLEILKGELDAQEIAYQYLDGSTPAPERSRRVRAFQEGQGEVFLISLKAGGFGLNLTAADYVIHMDPWWNPAVEDQASDRAHRIGQQRPVTVYRLVAKNTVEEKILTLHQQKRDLVDGLLEGADQAPRLSAAELLKLMSE